MRRSSLAGLVAVILLALPAVSSAATRYVAPTGSGEQTCENPANACSLDSGIGGSSVGDTVRMATGTYNRSWPIFIHHAIVLEGEPGAPRPTLAVDGYYPWGPTIALDLGNGAHVRNLAITATHPETCCFKRAVTVASGAILEQATVTGGQNIGTGVVFDNSGGTLRDTVVVNNQSVHEVDGIAAYANATIDGVTVLADRALLTPTDTPMTLDVRNTILMGSTHDWSFYGDGVAAVVNLTNTRLSTKNSMNGVGEPQGTRDAVRTYDPLLTADGHQTDASPTIDDGTAIFVAGRGGARDVDGGPRVLGDNPDIGADETATGDHWIGTPSVVRTGSKAAIVRVPVNAAGADPVDVSLSWGSAGRDLDDVVPGADMIADQDVLGLSPGTQYTLNASATQDGTTRNAPSSAFQTLPLPQSSVTVPKPSRNPRPTFVFGSDAPEAVTFECSVAGRAYVPCTSPWKVTEEVPVGTHQVAVRATDWSGGRGPAATKDFEITASPVFTPVVDKDDEDEQAPAVVVTPQVETPQQQPAPPVIAQPFVQGLAPLGTLAPRAGKVAFRDGKVQVPVTNPNTDPATVVGSLRRGGRTLAKGRLRLAAGQRGTLVLSLTKAGRKAAKRSLFGTVTLSIGSSRRYKTFG